MHYGVVPSPFIMEEIMEKAFNGHLFQTAGCYYLYDVPQNVILNITRDIYHILCDVQSKKKSMEEARKNPVIAELLAEGFLSDRKVQNIKHPSTDHLQQILDSSLHMLTLQVTQNCNLRCRYCVYSGSYINRQHTNKRMSYETAQMAIDFYLAHSMQTPKLRFGFYGGEPTLEMPLIEKCVAYILQNAKGKEVEFNLTTNATMLNDENLRFFVDHNFYLTISLDGAEEIQNKNRVYAESGKGTFERVITSVEKIKKEYPDFLNNVHFNVVMDQEDGYRASSDFFTYDDSVHGIYVSATEKNDANYKNEIIKNIEYYSNRGYEQFKAVYDYYRAIPDKLSPLVAGYLGSIKKSIADVLMPDKTDFDTGHPGGPCVPGLQRLFVSADGVFYPCERVNEEAEIMKIGDLEHGIDISKVEKLLNVGRITASACENCWAFRFCTSCAVYAEDGDVLSSEKRLKRCNAIRNSTEGYFKEYCILKQLKMDFDELEETEL